MKAAVAVQRNVLELMYTLFKKQEKYNKDYLKTQNQPEDAEIAIKKAESNIK